MTLKRLTLFICLCIPALASAVDDIASHQQFFQKCCVQCHGKTKPKGDVRLYAVATIDSALWKDVYEQFASEAMPPDNKPQPTKTERRAVLQYVLEFARKHSPVTSTGFRRLNKREYGNTVRDLLGLRKGT